jgi:hypothetical protein
MYKYSFRLLLLLIYSLLFLISCKDVTTELLDLSGILFCIFCFLLVIQIYSDRIVSLNLFKKINEYSIYLRKPIPLISKIIGCILLLIGFTAEGLPKICIFIGIIAFILGYFTKKYNQSENDLKMRSLSLKVIGLCITFGISLFFIMFYGSKHIKL